MEIISSITGTAQDSLSNPAIGNFSDEEGKAYIKNHHKCGGSVRNYLI